MKSIITLAISSLISFSVSAETKIISPSDAKNFIGKEVKVCGEYVYLKEFSKGIYMSLDDKFPNESMTLILWDSILPKIENKWGELPTFKNKQVCGTGNLSNYKGHYRISINSRYGFEVEAG